MKTITDISQLDLNGSYTYADYLTWWFDERIELINGKIYKMSPAPSSYHQKVSINIIREISWFLKRKRYNVYAAPFDVRLFRKSKEHVDKQIFTVVQPDICVICDITKIDEKGCLGSPDLIVEILSPFTNKMDLNEKYNLYQESGVQEYWVVHPKDQILQIFELENDLYREKDFYTVNDIITTPILSGFELKVSEVFE